MKIENLRIIEKMPFEEYLALPGLSFSGVRNDGTIIEDTEKMRFGSLVDAYLFEPHTYNGQKLKLVREVAKAAKEKFGDALKYGKRQVVVTCLMVHQGIALQYKGRIDLLCGGGVASKDGFITVDPSRGAFVIDMKISELDLLKAINFFGYHNQVNGYAIPLGIPVSIIVSINPKTLKPSSQAIPTKTEFWEKIVLQYGKVHRLHDTVRPSEIHGAGGDTGV